jgi:malate dehydrogenase (oxaloacetate-decarboxylating)
LHDVDLLVATVAEEILGIGDWDSNGMDISRASCSMGRALPGADSARPAKGGRRRRRG